ncbi:MAG: beta-ketoacyl-[acyl-carrier-protein] synthase family protein, partial [Planctomycetota bacterium]|nr:beta-ketoacyl-[acyl-carrier-protein] synthase family protein [Planctomycetota bacterium]
MRRRVVITGIGMVNPLATNPEQVWTRLKNGESSVDYTTVFDAQNFPTKIASEVKGYDVTEFGADPKDWEFQGRHTRFAAGAAVQAMDDSGVIDSISDPTRFGIYLGSGEGKQDFSSFTKMMVAGIEAGKGELDMVAFTKAGMESINPAIELEQEPNMPAGHLAAMFNAQGPNANCLTACAASSQAIGEATQIIRRGDAEVMLSGGTHSMIHPFGVTGFNLLTALSTRNDEPTKASRPFDRTRDGFVLGEGGAMVILEELEYAKARGARIY